MNKVDPKETMISKLQESLVEHAKQLRENESVEINDKLIQMDVVLDTMKFLEDYDENVQALNKYLEKKKIKKFDRSR